MTKTEALGRPLSAILAAAVSGAGAGQAHGTVHFDPPPEVQARTLDRKLAAFAVADFWTEPSRETARRLILKYGAPDEIRDDRLVWLTVGSWSVVVVYKAPPMSKISQDRPDVLQLAAGYPLGLAASSDLKAFCEKIFVDRKRNLIGARVPDEETGFAILNLADDIVRGRLSIEQAREELNRLRSLTEKNLPSPYTAGLLFGFGG